MRRDDRDGRELQHVGERLVRDVRDVHHHAQAIQLAYHLLAEIGQAVVLRLVGGRIRPVVVLEVRQREIADAEPGEIAERAQIVVDHVAALHAHERRNLLLRYGAADIGGRGGEHQVVGVLTDAFVHAVNELQRPLHGQEAR